MAQSACWRVVDHSLPTFIKMAWITQVCFITIDKKVEYEKGGWVEESIKRTCQILLIYFITFFSLFNSFVLWRSMIDDMMDDYKFKIRWFKSEKVHKKNHDE